MDGRPAARAASAISHLRSGARRGGTSGAQGTQRRRGFVDLLLSDLLRVEFDLMTERGAVGRLLRKYADRPMSLADACLVRLAELNDTASVLTIDGDFAVYRKHGRRAIALISP